MEKDEQFIKLLMQNISDAIRVAQPHITDEEYAIAIFRVLGRIQWRRMINEF